MKALLDENAKPVIIHNPPEKCERLKRTTFSPKVTMVSKDKQLFSMFSGSCLPCIHVYKPEIDLDVLTGETFHKENDTKKGNKILVWKAEKGSDDSQPRTSFRESECFIPLLEQLTTCYVPIEWKRAHYEIQCKSDFILFPNCFYLYYVTISYFNFLRVIKLT